MLEVMASAAVALPSRSILMTSFVELSHPSLATTGIHRHLLEVASQKVQHLISMIYSTVTFLVALTIDFLTMLMMLLAVFETDIITIISMAAGLNISLAGMMMDSEVLVVALAEKLIIVVAAVETNSSKMTDGTAQRRHVDVLAHSASNSLVKGNSQIHDVEQLQRSVEI
jgi:hypothetical protein